MKYYAYKANRTRCRLRWRRCVVWIGCVFLFSGGMVFGLADYADGHCFQESKKKEQQEKSQYVGGASLNTDPDLMERLKKADEFKKDGSFRAATKLWQSVLGESGDILYTDDDETYFSLTERVETVLAELTPEGLSAYRISADAAAREILAQRKGDYDLDALNKVVKGYFLSSLGDDAAYQLGCLYLDNYDFVGAARLLRKITDQYPDPSVSMGDVWLRIALAYAYIGDPDSAKAALESAIQAGLDPESRLYESVKSVLDAAPRLQFTSTARDEWTHRWGNSNHMSQMPALPAGYGATGLVANWQFCFEPRAFYGIDHYEGVAISPFDVDAIDASVTSTEKELIAQWRNGKWRPAGSLLMSNNAIAFKAGADVTVWDRDLQNEPLWRPLWLNQFTIDDASATYKALFDNYRISNSKIAKEIPEKTQEVQLFGDQIAQAMSIYRGVLYSIEGPEYSWNSQRKSSKSTTQRNPYGSLPRRTRVNRLAAYDFETGKILWTIPPNPNLTVPQKGTPTSIRRGEVTEESESEKAFENIGFMGSPLGFGDLLLAPVNVGGSIFLYAFDTENQGRLVWRSFLCDEPGGGSQPWSPIHVAIEGSTAYVNCGTGVVFAVDPLTGGIRFARRYPRTGEPNNYLARFGGNAEMLELDGWQEDVVIPVGNELIMLASDYNAVWAIDRQTAKFVWKTENQPFGEKFDYLIGVNDEYVFLGGTKSIAAISIKAQGRWEWVYNLEDEESLGRAMLTEDAVYVPLSRSILKLGLNGKNGGGDVQQTIPVRLGVDAPIGNLYSDGRRIWVVGANRLYALDPDGPDEVESPPLQGTPQENQSDSSDQNNNRNSSSVLPNLRGDTGLGSLQHSPADAGRSEDPLINFDHKEDA